MADHFYSQAVGDIGNRDPAKLTIGTSTAGGSVIEIRITDASVTRKQAYDFLEFVSDEIAANISVLPVGGFTG